MHKIGIIGATGFTGSELIRILVAHPGVEVSLLTSESKAGLDITVVHPFLQGIVSGKLVSADILANNESLDLVFLALPHGVSMDYVKKLENKSFKIIDLSGDFRLSGPGVYEQWYAMPHRYEQGFNGAVYGIPEIYRPQISNAGFVANPGCFPTGALLALAPLVKKERIGAQTIIVDAKTGVTGAGVQSKPLNHFSNVHDNFKAYGLKHHRHTIEIEEKLNEMSNEAFKVQFTPHLLPVDRGILTTIYARPQGKTDEHALQQLYREYYNSDPFIRILNHQPSIKSVRGTNFCDIHIAFDERTENIIITSAIDNLVRGAAGEAVQNMNLMLGLEESAGLGLIPLMP